MLLSCEIVLAKSEYEQLKEEKFFRKNHIQVIPIGECKYCLVFKCKSLALAKIMIRTNEQVYNVSVVK